MSQWITDRRPTQDDAYNGMVWYCYPDVGEPRLVEYRQFELIAVGHAWMPITPPEPYVVPEAQADYTDHLRAEVDRLEKLCNKYERVLNGLQEAGVIS